MERGSQFLHQKDSKLHTSQPIEREQARRKRAQELTSHKPTQKLEAWLAVLERTHIAKGGSEARQAAQPQVLERIKQSYHKDLVIKPENVPDSVYELEARIARERGHGDVPLTDEYREAKQREIINNQTASLDKWVDYLASDDATYPTWAKYWAFTAVTKMGKFSKKLEKQPDGTEREVAGFANRDATTVAPFAPINPRALALTIGVMSERLDQQGLPKAERASTNVSTLLDNVQFQKLASSENFAKLYTQFLLEIPEYSAEGLQETRGEWVVYPQGSDPLPLVQSLEGYPLEWCTADKDTAQGQLEAGDFYVYYSFDQDGKARIPRAAIRMEGEGNDYFDYDYRMDEDGYYDSISDSAHMAHSKNQHIAEVRGIAHNQNLDPYIADVVADKMHEFSDGESYTRKAADMHQLTSIEQQIKDNPGAVLTQDQLIFLYELDHNIEGFGYERDPRIDEVIASRGEIDHSELRLLAVETLRQKFEASYQGYNTIVSQLNEQRIPQDHVPLLTQEHLHNLFEAKMAEWEARSVLKYLADKIVEDYTMHTLVITPNTTADFTEIVTLATIFGQDQPYETIVSDDIYQFYTPAELSGPLEPGQDTVHLSLVPSKKTSELGQETVKDHLAVLSTLIQEKPNLNLHVPSVLDALVYWQTLRVGGDSLSGTGSFAKTYIRHFDLEFDKHWLAPCSYVEEIGMPRLNGHLASDYDDGRLAVR